MKIVEILSLDESKQSITIRLTSKMLQALDAVLEHRKAKRLTEDRSELIRQCITVAMMCDDPENKRVHFELPDMEALAHKLNPATKPETTTETAEAEA